MRIGIAQGRQVRHLWPTGSHRNESGGLNWPRQTFELKRGCGAPRISAVDGQSCARVEQRVPLVRVDLCFRGATTDEWRRRALQPNTEVREAARYQYGAVSWPLGVVTSVQLFPPNLGRIISRLVAGTLDI